MDERAVAVLPFENLSGAADADPFAAGLHDDLLTELSRISGLTVISRTSVKRYSPPKVLEVRCGVVTGDPDPNELPTISPKSLIA